MLNGHSHLEFVSSVSTPGGKKRFTSLWMSPLVQNKILIEDSDVFQHAAGERVIKVEVRQKTEANIKTA